MKYQHFKKIEELKKIEEFDNELDKLLDSIQKEQGKIDLTSANKESLDEEENKKEAVENKKFSIEV